MKTPLAYSQNPGGAAVIQNLEAAPGAVFFVDSTSANKTSGAGVGTTPDAPFDTLSNALAQCTANAGDTIFLMPGHAENIAAAAAIAINKAGVRIIGLGRGSKRPTFTFITSTAATITVTAADVWIKNCLFVNGIDALVQMINISAADVKIEECEVRDNDASFQVTDAIVTTAAADRLQIINHTHRANGGKTGASSQIKIVGGDGILIIPRLMDGDCSNANIYNVTTAATDLRIFASGDLPAYIRNRGTTKVVITLHASSTGQVGPNICARISGAGASNITNAVVGAAMDFYQPIAISNTAGTVGLNTTITASANS